MSAKIRSLPLTGLCASNDDIAANLRALADEIESDDMPVRNTFMVIERRDGELDRRTFGDPCDVARSIGVLQIACARAAERPS